ncbi:hypothetical protein J6590_041731 [Homalodisca vitripennis]|nr:hypothetical protein J6590_041731 [Homalodisca vitripennis]
MGGGRGALPVHKTQQPVQSRARTVTMQDEHCIRMGEYILRFEDGPEIGESFEERALRELRETPERRAEALEQLRDLLRDYLLRPPDQPVISPTIPPGALGQPSHSTLGVGSAQEL